MQLYCLFIFMTNCNVMFLSLFLSYVFFHKKLLSKYCFILINVFCNLIKQLMLAIYIYELLFEIIFCKCYLNLKNISYLSSITEALIVFKCISKNIYHCFYSYELKLKTNYESYIIHIYFPKQSFNSQTIEVHTNYYLLRIHAKHSYLFNLLIFSNVR